MRPDEYANRLHDEGHEAALTQAGAGSSVTVLVGKEADVLQVQTDRAVVAWNGLAVRRAS